MRILAKLKRKMNCEDREKLEKKEALLLFQTEIVDIIGLETEDSDYLQVFPEDVREIAGSANMWMRWLIMVYMQYLWLVTGGQKKGVYLALVMLSRITGGVRKMIRVLAKIMDSQTIDKIKEYGNILFVSNFTDIVGVETTEKGLENIKHLDGVSQVRLSEKGVLLRKA